MNIQFDENKLLNAMDDFYNATGINIAIIDDKGTLMLQKHKFYNEYCSLIQSTSQGKNRCIRSDIILMNKCRLSKKMESRICHAGLMDIIIPVLFKDTVLCYLIFGQFKREKDFDKIKNTLSELPLDIMKMRKLYNTLTPYVENKIQSIANIATILSRYILLEDMLKPNINDNAERALAFIDENLESKLSIQDICKHTNISKSVLYKVFHAHFNCTVNEYISSERVKKSINMLLYTDMSIENIALSVGFSSTAYYGKMFKKYYGITPLKYRNEKKIYL